MKNRLVNKSTLVLVTSILLYSCECRPYTSDFQLDISYAVAQIFEEQEVPAIRTCISHNDSIVKLPNRICSRAIRSQHIDQWNDRNVDLTHFERVEINIMMLQMFKGWQFVDPDTISQVENPPCFRSYYALSTPLLSKTADSLYIELSFVNSHRRVDGFLFLWNEKDKVWYLNQRRRLSISC